MQPTLYLASGSQSRQSLLKAAKIPFTCIKQNADESVVDVSQNLDVVVQELALLKMKHVALPESCRQEGDILYILTADTLTRDSDGFTYGKPKDRDEAKAMLRACRSGATVASGFCVQKMQCKNGMWHALATHVGYNQAHCIVDIPEYFLDFYLDRVPFTSVSGGITIEGFGEQFVREVQGSYSAIIGIPMYQVRESLYNLGFYKNFLRI